MRRKYPSIRPGDRFSRLTVVERAGVTSNGMARWLCSCDCGGSATVDVGSLNRGTSRSCGCYQKEVASKTHRTHGCSVRADNTYEYRAWAGAKDRVNNLNCSGRKNYGGRGIKMCKEWEDSFPQFLADMGLCPSARHSLGRIDNDGDYCPENCRWETWEEQQNNKRTNRMVDYLGRKQSLARWCRELGRPYRVVYDRIVRAGWSIERALKTPRRERGITVEYRGKRRLLTDVCVELGIEASVVRHRIRRAGWDIKKALETPVGSTKPKKAR